MKKIFNWIKDHKKLSLIILLIVVCILVGVFVSLNAAGVIGIFGSLIGFINKDKARKEVEKALNNQLKENEKQINTNDGLIKESENKQEEIKKELENNMPVDLTEEQKKINEKLKGMTVEEKLKMLRGL